MKVVRVSEPRRALKQAAPNHSGPRDTYSPMKMFWYFAFAAMALSGCGGQLPQTSSEFRHAVQGGAFMSRMHSAIVPQPFEAVIANLRKYALPCLARTQTSVVMSSSPGDMSSGMVIYRPKLRLVGPESAELTLQMGPTFPP